MNRVRSASWLACAAAAAFIAISGATLEQAGAGFSDETNGSFTITIEGTGSPESEPTPEVAELQPPEATTTQIEEEATPSSDESSQEGELDTSSLQATDEDGSASEEAASNEPSSTELTADQQEEASSPTTVETTSIQGVMTDDTAS